MGNLTKMRPRCAACGKKDTCNRKRLCAEAYLETPAAESSVIAAAPVARETMNIMVNGAPTVVYKDEIQKELEKALFKDRFLNFGA